MEVTSPVQTNLSRTETTLGPARIEILKRSRAPLYARTVHARSPLHIVTEKVEAMGAEKDEAVVLLQTLIPARGLCVGSRYARE